MQRISDSNILDSHRTTQMNRIIIIDIEKVRSIGKSVPPSNYQAPNQLAELTRPLCWHTNYKAYEKEHFFSWNDS